MELPSKLLEQIAFNTRPEVEERMLIVMDKNTHEEHLFQPTQTKKNNFRYIYIYISFLTAYNCIFKVRNLNNEFYLAKSITEEYFTVISIQLVLTKSKF